MKMAYANYQVTKELISIQSFARRNRDALAVLQSEEFKTLERIVTNEELPITLFLTSLSKSLAFTGKVYDSNLLSEEVADLFTLRLSREQLELILAAQIQTIIRNSSNIPNQRAVLEYCLELSWVVDCESFFEKEIAKHISFEKNAIFKSRAKLTVEELQQVLVQ